MAGRGRAPKPDRVNQSDVPIRGENVVASASGWVGEVPSPPDGLMPASLEAWSTWFAAWFASFWTVSDVPALRQMVRLFDQVERGEFQRATELRLMMDTYGVTPKGQQDRRWKPPVAGAAPVAGVSGAYAHLRAV